MASRITVGILDYSLERSPVTLSGVDLTAGNFAAQAILMDDFVTAVDGVTLGTLSKDTRLASETSISDAQPASPFAQREMKWLVRYSDTVNPVGNGHFEVPTPDLALLDAQGEFMDLTLAAAIAFVDAVEAYGRSRLGNAITVQSVEYVGRNI